MKNNKNAQKNHLVHWAYQYEFLTTVLIRARIWKRKRKYTAVRALKWVSHFDRRFNKGRPTPREKFWSPSNWRYVLHSEDEHTNNKPKDRWISLGFLFFSNWQWIIHDILHSKKVSIILSLLCYLPNGIHRGSFYFVLRDTKHKNLDGLRL